MVQSIHDTFNPIVEDQSNTVTPDEQAPKASKDKVKKLAEKTQKPVTIPIASDTAALQDAENSLRSLSRFTGKNIIVYRSAHFYPDGRIMLHIVDPDNSNAVDRYTYKNGEWQAPQPVQITKSDDIANFSINLDKAPFVRANRVYRIIVEKLKEIKAGHHKATVYYVPYKGKLRWFPTRLNTDRSRYTITFSPEGRLISFKQD